MREHEIQYLSVYFDLFLIKNNDNKLSNEFAWPRHSNEPPNELSLYLDKNFIDAMQISLGLFSNITVLLSV